MFPEFECLSLSFRNRCPTIRLNNGRVRTRSSGRLVRVSCNWPFKLVRGREIMTCVGREWDYEYPICASKFILYIYCCITIYNTYLKSMIKYFSLLNLSFYE